MKEILICQNNRTWREQVRMYSGQAKFQIIKKTVGGADKKHMIKLNRASKCLEIFDSTSTDLIRANYPIREDFNFSEYMAFEKTKEIPCIFGRKDSETPCGIFNIEFKSKDFYVREYGDYGDTKFFGYMGFFEDYLIHSNIYLMGASEKTMRNGEAKSISLEDKDTGGCIRIGQEDLDYLLEIIEIGTIVML